MAEAVEVLAWRKGEGTGDLYGASALRSAEKVKEVFAACKAARGYITAEGWEFLFGTWQAAGLLKLDLDVGWFHSGQEDEHTAHLVYQSLMAGYNPMSGEKGDYDADAGLFLSHRGRKEKIDWEGIMQKGI